MTISSENRRRAAIPEMRRIQQAIAAGDADAASVATRDHVHRAADIAREFLHREFMTGETSVPASDE
jgi:DNA-binding FadR family transcriptional regulator